MNHIIEKLVVKSIGGFIYITCLPLVFGLSLYDYIMRDAPENNALDEW